MNCESANLPFGADNPKSDIVQFQIFRFCCSNSSELLHQGLLYICAQLWLEEKFSKESF